MTPDTEELVDDILAEVKDELEKAMEKFPSMRSAHEGVAIIEEEFLEFREAAFWPHKFGHGIDGIEARQLAAMAVRYLVDVAYNTETPR